VNVLPNTATRVPLSLIDGDETSDFINANFVSGYGWPKKCAPRHHRHHRQNH
jgi:hypothetical protein